jgi:hypothetical protein
MSEPTPSLRAADKDEIADHVRDVLHREFRDARYVELESAAAIANRVMGWAKLFGFFAGIPLVIIAVWLGWLGYKSIADVGRLVKELEGQLTALEKDVEGKRTQLAKLNELDTIEQRLNSLSTRVASLESVKFGGSANIGTDAQRRIEDTLTRYQAHFAALGVRFEANQVAHVQIEKSASMSREGMIAYYDPSKNAMVVDEKYTASDDVVLREYTHRILLRANPRAKTLSDYNLMGLESGLADYFSRSFADSPEYTSLPGRTLVNAMKVSPARDYADVQTIGLAWGGLGWNLRTKLGRNAADKLLLAAWENTQLSAPTATRDFAQALVNADQSLNGGANLALLRAELAKRGVSM